MIGIVFVSFKDIILSPNTFVLGNSYDGQKNYFGYLAYLKNSNESIELLTKVNFPYGESIHYLDIMPVFSVVIKSISKYIIDLYPISLGLMNYFLILNIIICFIFSYKLFGKILSNQWLIGLGAIIISMTNPMLFRINNHFALSLSSLIMGYFYFLYLLYQAVELGDNKRIFRYLIVIILWISLASFFHFYFQALLSCHFGFSILFLFIRNFKKLNLVQKFSLLIAPLLSPILSLWILKITDPFYSQRPSQGNGYNWDGYNFKLDALYSVKGTPAESFPFFINSNYTFSYESMGYLGGFILYGMIVLIIYSIIHKKMNFSNDVYVSNLLLTSILMLAISLGHTINISNGAFLTNNWLSAFYWLSNFSESITHFRVLSRFNWLFFFGVFVWAVYLYDINFKGKWGTICISIILIIGCIDVFDWSKHLAKSDNNEYPFTISSEYKSKLNSVEKLNLKGIYYFPFYYVGTSFLDLTLDDYIAVSNMAFKTTLETGIPTMNLKASRTSTIQTISQLKKLNEFYLHKQLEKDSYLVYSYNKPVENINSFWADKHFFGKWNQMIKNMNGEYLFSENDFDIYLVKF